jgi:electron transfer flavoprotein alpha subunit
MTQTLVLVEHERGRVRSPSLHAITAAGHLAGETALLILGSGLDSVASPLRSLGASKVLTADHPALEHPLADRYAAVIARVAIDTGATTVIATSSTFTRDVLPRVAALLDAPMLSDVLSIDQRDDAIVCRRPVYAGSAVATAALAGDRRVLTIRAAAFEAPAPDDATPCPVEPIDVDTGSLPDAMEFVSAAQR